MRGKIGYVLALLFCFAVGRAILSLVGIFTAPTCNAGDVCYKSYLNAGPNLDLHVFVSDSSKSGNFQPLFQVEQFDYTQSLERFIDVELSKPARLNGSLYIHTVIVPHKKRNKPNINELLDIRESTYIKNRITKFALPLSATFNLLRDSSLNKGQIKPVTHLRSKYYLVMLTDELHLPHNQIPPEFIRHIRINQNRQFMPIAQQDSLQMRLKDLTEISPESKTVQLHYNYLPRSLGKMRFLMQMEMTLLQCLELGFTEKDLDDVKGVFADTNVYLLCATLLIGSIHLLLDFLSFKNDVSFWKTQTSMAGLSSRAVFWRAFSQTIVFFYLLDENTSLLVLVPSGIGTLIEFWKVSKVLKTSLSWTGGFKFSTLREETEAEKQTRKYDEECMKYLSWILYPLCLAAAGYSLIYQPHKSWYSWTINSLVNAVYAFGFLFMLPQLFINYRLKSVAALPWRAFTYRAFNTFIDDIFAFIITMPTAHRVACFRDDVVFLVYLYQRWLYPVDKSRTDDASVEVHENDKKTK